MICLLFLILLPISLDGGAAVLNCDKDACLRYSGSCDNGTGVWTAKIKHEKMDDAICNLTELMNNTNKVEYPDDYFHVQIETVNTTRWMIALFSTVKLSHTFSIKSPRLELRLTENPEHSTDEKDTKWNLTIDGKKRGIYIQRIHQHTITI
ncbi:hypothetical protein PMAYCL1PPCAC_07350 [Pristionchus mayeri]|uniref:Uncharacterized protein n=1 Tax=Pristionchus mayeri TaxID=1317129 RepID=A0AAN4ZHQ0_9BILA|nr:hypothetical protein PMAYCL1PPCAC_07350 [Pristionchus mayeri]